MNSRRSCEFSVRKYISIKPSVNRAHRPYRELLRPLLDSTFVIEAMADSEHVTIGMAKVHLTDVPGHIGGRTCDLQSGRNAMLVHLIHVVHPHRHPDALVTLFVSRPLKSGGVRAAAPASLRTLTKKDASFLARPNRAKRRRRSPIPQLFPSPLFKPRNRAGNAFSFHSRSRITSAPVLKKSKPQVGKIAKKNI